MGTIGIEWVHNSLAGNLSNTKAQAEGFYNTLSATRSFEWGDDLAWDEDFEQLGLGSPTAGTDTVWVDNVDFVFFSGHGSPDQFYFGIKRDDALAKRTEEEGDQGIAREQAQEIADRMVQTLAPDESRWDVHSVTEQEVLMAEREAREPRLRVAAMQVNYRFSLDDLPLLGPGAKMQIVVGPSGDVIGAYRFWREPKATDTARTIPPEVARERFSRSHMFSDLSDDTARAEVTEIRLGYLTLPPTEIQASLMPA